MCWANECCFCIPMDLGCIILGFANFIVSVAMMAASMTFYFTEQKIKGVTEEQPHFVAEYLNLDLKVGTVNIILSIMVIVCIFWMASSVCLVIGVYKREPNLILSFFSFGIILTILGLLSGLLMLLNQCWWLALIISFCSAINIHYLVVVHTVYDLMQKGHEFKFLQHPADDLSILVDSFDDNMEEA